MTLAAACFLGFMGRRRWEWYEPVVLALAAAIVWPDEVSEWLTLRTGREYARRSSLLIGGAAALGLALLTFFLIPHSPRIPWWSPLLIVGVFGVVRFITGWIRDILGTDRW